MPLARAGGRGGEEWSPCSAEGRALLAGEGTITVMTVVVVAAVLVVVVLVERRDGEEGEEEEGCCTRVDRAAAAARAAAGGGAIARVAYDGLLLVLAWCGRRRAAGRAAGSGRTISVPTCRS